MSFWQYGQGFTGSGISSLKDMLTLMFVPESRRSRKAAIRDEKWALDGLSPRHHSTIPADITRCRLAAF